MEHLSFDSFELVSGRFRESRRYVPFSVDLVSDDGVFDFGQMDPYLVRPAGLELQFKKRYERESLEDFVLCYGLPFYPCFCRYLFPVYAVPADGDVDCAFVCFHGAPDKGQVLSRCPAVLELADKRVIA